MLKLGNLDFLGERLDRKSVALGEELILFLSLERALSLSL